MLGISKLANKKQAYVPSVHTIFLDPDVFLDTELASSTAGRF